ncbi:MAG: HepT-like ribonuclease domain-containing protein [Campylobacterota bacterium]|nr:HepT-like ribonuclease domain-containing protein [Campylobacterota bacterium]
MDKSTSIELVNFILESIKIINRRFKTVKSSDDFLENDDGLDKLDAISMRIQSIGEAVKNLYKREEELLLEVDEKVYWSEIIKARDFISHHYVDIDSETVYDICENELDELQEKILKIRELI